MKSLPTPMHDDNDKQNVIGVDIDVVVKNEKILLKSDF